MGSMHTDLEELEGGFERLAAYLAALVQQLRFDYLN